jgi:myo-inositol-1(or 4)-monophosphatase
VAAGRFDGFWELALNPWDVAAGGLICEEAGARVTNVDGGTDYLSAPQSVIS